MPRNKAMLLSVVLKIVTRNKIFNRLHFMRIFQRVNKRTTELKLFYLTGVLKVYFQIRNKNNSLYVFYGHVFGVKIKVLNKNFIRIDYFMRI